MTNLARPLGADHHARLRELRDRPDRIDPSALAALAELLIVQRELDDTIGAEPMIAPVHAWLAILRRVVRGAPVRARPDAVRMAS